MDWPENKSFAFTIFDDTDFARVENVGEVYAMLSDLDIRTTKSVWPSRAKREPICGGDTCEDPEYLDWLHGLQAEGFEIAYHMNTSHTSTREETRRGLDRFEELFGRSPSSMANHAGCEENMYWGAARLTGFNRLVYNGLTKFKNRKKYRGHVEGDLLFWGDLCRDRIRYCRSFVYPEVNTLKVCPFMPYHDEKRPFVNNWFASSKGPNVDSFVTRLSERHQDRLEEEGGACIMYTHFASGFCDHGCLDHRFRSLVESLARRNGWFVPVTELLEYLMRMNGRHVIRNRERRQLERKWLWYKARVGTT